MCRDLPGAVAWYSPQLRRSSGVWDVLSICYLPRRMAVSTGNRSATSTGEDHRHTHAQRWSVWGILASWRALAIVVLLSTQVPSVMWSLIYPTPHHWDEADYLNAG